ncbi:MAG: translation initiation factor 2 [Oscillospiraceae bacterium]|nr:translation initiation factor 2 [Oscillospiraceae bacterium]
MVKGITRQVVVVHPSDTKLFEQAIFLVRDEALRNGGVSPEDILRQAADAARHEVAASTACRASAERVLFALGGAAVVGAAWLATALL